jgi:hypothetical protein
LDDCLSAFALNNLTFSSAAFKISRVEIEKASVAYHEEAFMPLYFVEAPKELPNMETLDKSKHRKLFV